MTKHYQKLGHINGRKCKLKAGGYDPNGGILPPFSEQHLSGLAFGHIEPISEKYWLEIENRISDYLVFLGLSKEEDLKWAISSIVLRVKLKNEARPFENILKAAIEEAVLFVDEAFASVSNSILGNINSDIKNSTNNLPISSLLARSAILVYPDWIKYAISSQRQKGDAASIPLFPANNIQHICNTSFIPPKAPLEMLPQNLSFYSPILCIIKFVIRTTKRLLRNFHSI